MNASGELDGGLSGLRAWARGEVARRLDPSMDSASFSVASVVKSCARRVLDAFEVSEREAAANSGEHRSGSPVGAREVMSTGDAAAAIRASKFDDVREDGDLLRRDVMAAVEHYGIASQDFGVAIHRLDRGEAVSVVDEDGEVSVAHDRLCDLVTRLWRLGVRLDRQDRLSDGGRAPSEVYVGSVGSIEETTEARRRLEKRAQTTGDCFSDQEMDQIAARASVAVMEGQRARGAVVVKERSALERYARFARPTVAGAIMTALRVLDGEQHADLHEIQRALLDGELAEHDSRVARGVDVGKRELEWARGLRSLLVAVTKGAGERLFDAELRPSQLVVPQMYLRQAMPVLRAAADVVPSTLLSRAIGAGLAMLSLRDSVALTSQAERELVEYTDACGGSGGDPQLGQAIDVLLEWIGFPRDEANESNRVSSSDEDELKNRCSVATSALASIADALSLGGRETPWIENTRDAVLARLRELPSIGGRSGQRASIWHGLDGIGIGDPRLREAVVAARRVRDLGAGAVLPPAHREVISEAIAALDARELRGVDIGAQAREDRRGLASLLAAVDATASDEYSRAHHSVISRCLSVLRRHSHALDCVALVGALDAALLVHRQGDLERRHRDVLQRVVEGARSDQDFSVQVIDSVLMAGGVNFLEARKAIAALLLDEARRGRAAVAPVVDGGVEQTEVVGRANPQAEDEVGDFVRVHSSGLDGPGVMWLRLVSCRPDDLSPDVGVDASFRRFWVDEHAAGQLLSSVSRVFPVVARSAVAEVESRDVEPSGMQGALDLADELGTKGHLAELTTWLGQLRDLRESRRAMELSSALDAALEVARVGSEIDGIAVEHRLAIDIWLRDQGPALGDGNPLVRALQWLLGVVDERAARSPSSASTPSTSTSRRPATHRISELSDRLERFSRGLSVRLSSLVYRRLGRPGVLDSRSGDEPADRAGDDEMASEYDFSRAERGKFFRRCRLSIGELELIGRALASSETSTAQRFALLSALIASTRAVELDSASRATLVEMVGRWRSSGGELGELAVAVDVLMSVTGARVRRRAAVDDTSSEIESQKRALDQMVDDAREGMTATDAESIDRVWGYSSPSLTRSVGDIEVRCGSCGGSYVARAGDLDGAETDHRNVCSSTVAQLHGLRVVHSAVRSVMSEQVASVARVGGAAAVSYRQSLVRRASGGGPDADVAREMLVAFDLHRGTRASMTVGSGAVSPELAFALVPLCGQCGERPAVCVGRYEGESVSSPACGECCAHGNEDGRCRPLQASDWTHWTAVP